MSALTSVNKTVCVLLLYLFRMCGSIEVLAAFLCAAQTRAAHFLFEIFVGKAGREHDARIKVSAIII